MSERPILFSGKMVRAILDGRKTQTRRVVKPQPIPEPARIKPFGDGTFYCESNSGKVGIFHPAKFPCPYGKVGNRLYVQENFKNPAYSYTSENVIAVIHYVATDTLSGWIEAKRLTEEEKYHFTNKQSEQFIPAKHMPRWASRITLEITGIRVERVQDICVGDALKEGITEHIDEVGTHDSLVTLCAFKNLWDSIYAKRGFGWDVNSWVWAIEFRRVK